MPVICMTGYANIAEQPRHCRALIRKPFGRAAMCKVLRSIFVA